MKSNIKLNQLPVPTWRWLKVNHTTLDHFEMGEITSYDRHPLRMAPQSGFELQAYGNKLHFMDIDRGFPYRKPTGVSENMLELAKEQFNTGVILRIHGSAHLESPIWLSFANDSKQRNIIDNNIIIAEENSHCTVIMDYSSKDTSPGFHNGYTRVYAKDGARIQLIKIQGMNDTSVSLDSIITTLSRNAQVYMITVELGAQNSVVSVVSHMEGENATSNMDTIYLTDGLRRLDMNYHMNHYARRSQSNINVQGAMKDHSKKTFKGTLDFKKGASLSKGSEEEYAILLNQGVHCHSIPLLLCEEDDVQGQHAASAGRMDEDQLYYLMSRGISLRDARKIIIESAFGPIVDKIPLSELQEHIKAILDNRLSQMEENENE